MSKSENPSIKISISEYNDIASILESSSLTSKKKAIIIGAGPTGLTAAYELLTRSNIIPIVLEKTDNIGGLSGLSNQDKPIDIGYYPLISRYKRVLKWCEDIKINNNNNNNNNNNEDLGNHSDKIGAQVLRVYFLRVFFTYPLQLTWGILVKSGVLKTIFTIGSFLKARILSDKPNTLETYLISRYGKIFYNTFQKDYLENILGYSCKNISVDLGLQTIQKLLFNPPILGRISDDKLTNDYHLIEKCFLPTHSISEFWQDVAKLIKTKGGVILLNHDVVSIESDNNSISSIKTFNNLTQETNKISTDYLISTIQVKDLIQKIEKNVPKPVKEIAQGLAYRNIITIGILINRLSYQNPKTGEWEDLKITDIWLNIYEEGIRSARILFYDNCSTYRKNELEPFWIGIELYCNKEDNTWNMEEAQLKNLAIQEITKLGLVAKENILDVTFLKKEEAIPLYFGSYKQFNEIKNYTNTFANLYLIGCNGMHKCCNTDFSMLSAMTCVDNIYSGTKTKENIWSLDLNTQIEYPKNKIENHKEHSKKTKNILLDFIFKDKRNKWYARIGIVALILQLTAFKYLYPYASFINGDSYSYLETAYHNLPINTYPIGYSMFLRFFSIFTKSDTTLVIFQYLFAQLSLLAFIFTMFYFYKPSRVTKVVLFSFILFNPAILYLANYISSDAFFLALSTIWFTQLFWITNAPTKRLIFINAIILFVAFTVRYNALFYPIIAVIAIFQGRQKTMIKISGISLSFILIAAFIINNIGQYHRLTGYQQFTPFTGWQTANNALYAYRFVDSAHVKKVPKRFSQIDKMVRNYFDSTKDFRKHPQETLIASTVYMWAPNSPLNLYMEKQFNKDSNMNSLKKWATVAPFLSDYGSLIITNYPKEYLKYYLIPNAIKYYAPPVEFLSQYSTGVDSVSPIASVWFNYKTNKLKTRVNDYKVDVLNFYPILTGTMNIVLLFCLFSFFLLKGASKSPKLKHGMLLVITLWVVNFGFSVIAAPIALRFQLFPILVSLSFTIFLLEFLIKSAFESESIKVNVTLEEEKIKNDNVIA